MKSIRSHPTRSLLLLMLLLSALSFVMEYAAHGRLSALYLRVQVPTLLFAAGCILLLGMAQRAPQGTTLWSRFLSALHRFSSGHRAAFASLCCLFVGLLRWVLSGVFSWWTLADALAGAALVSLLLWFQCSGESC